MSAFYKLLERTSVGGLSDLWLTRYESPLGFRKGLMTKRLQVYLEEDIELRGCFEQEAVIGAQLQHPSIVQYQALERIEDHTCLIREFVPGLSLNTLYHRAATRGGPPELSLAVWIVIRIAEALSYAHAMGQPHLELHPRHVLLSFLGEVKLVGFGEAATASSFRDRRSGPAILKGQFMHMSPEQVRGLALDGRSDIFSLGTMLYHLATGTHPFRRDSEFRTLEAIYRSDPASPSELNPQLPRPITQVIERALIRDRETRYQTAKEMALALREAAQRTGLIASARTLSQFMSERFPAERMAAQRLLSKALALPAKAQDEDDTIRLLGIEALLPGL